MEAMALKLEKALVKAVEMGPVPAPAILWFVLFVAIVLFAYFMGTAPDTGILILLPVAHHHAPQDSILHNQTRSSPLQTHVYEFSVTEKS